MANPAGAGAAVWLERDAYRYPEIGPPTLKRSPHPLTLISRGPRGWQPSLGGAAAAFGTVGIVLVLRGEGAARGAVIAHLAIAFYLIAVAIGRWAWFEGRPQDARRIPLPQTTLTTIDRWLAFAWRAALGSALGATIASWSFLALV